MARAVSTSWRSTTARCCHHDVRKSAPAKRPRGIVVVSTRSARSARSRTLRSTLRTAQGLVLAAYRIASGSPERLVSDSPRAKRWPSALEALRASIDRPLKNARPGRITSRDENEVSHDETQTRRKRRILSVRVQVDENRPRVLGGLGPGWPVRRSWAHAGARPTCFGQSREPVEQNSPALRHRAPHTLLYRTLTMARGYGFIKALTPPLLALGNFVNCDPLRSLWELPTSRNPCTWGVAGGDEDRVLKRTVR